MPTIAKWSMRLNWKEFNINLGDLETWLKTNAGEHYCGNSAHSCLELWFLEEPSEEIKEAIQDKWDLLDEESDEAVSYKSNAELRAEAEVKKASGRAKLLSLGLTEEEVAALLGA
jgi:hypothetical protein